MALESNKKELILGLNSFDKAAEASGKEAWILLIIYLFFINKGSYPSNPNIGIGIRQYDYEFMDTALDVLPSEIMEQVRLFLPDIPLESVNVTSDMVAGKKILVIILEFVDDTINDTAVIAAMISQNIIDFEVSM